MQLVQFNAEVNTVALSGKGGMSGVRLLTAKEYKEANGLKGAEGKRQYNDYLRKAGAASTGDLAAALTTGELLVKSVKSWESGAMQVSFMRKSSIKDPKAPTVAEPAEITKEAAILALGLTVAEYELLMAAKK